MGRKLDALLGRKFKTSKLKATVNLAVARIVILKNQRQSRLDVARSDIIQLLNLGHHEHALLRVDQLIKEQNMLDVYVMVDGYCHLLMQMVNLIEQEKECPEELREATASLLYASPRCGEFPELQEIRAILTARYGKDFARGAIELRNNCGVSIRMIQKLTPRQAGLEARMKTLQEIAMENDIILKLDDPSPVIKKDELGVEQKQNQPTSSGIEKNSGDLDNEFDEEMSFSESRKGKKKYRDVEDAAQAAYEAAEYAATAARAAVELSRSRSFGSDNPDSPNSRLRSFGSYNPDSPNSRPRKVLSSKEKFPMDYEKNHESDTESETEPEHEPNVTIVEKEDEILKNNKKQQVGNTTVFDESDNEIEKEPTGFSLSRNYDESLNAKLDFGFENTEPQYDEGPKMQQGVQQLDLTKKPISVRNKRVYGR
uniref:uncharacterized protein LOC122596754 n=1 Tax=Erigeron canadensis TaxID=72917 RepID=UPI001CB95F31|nr:uncharacterized protein LOC122596754 [Erigeron canadensis]